MLHIPMFVKIVFVELSSKLFFGYMLCQLSSSLEYGVTRFFCRLLQISGLIFVCGQMLDGCAMEDAGIKFKELGSPTGQSFCNFSNAE